MILKTRKIGIIDGATGNAVTLSHINEGVDGSSVFGLSNEHDGLTIDDGQFYPNVANPVLDVRVLKPSSADITQLESWANNQTDVYVTGLTLDGCFMFGGFNGITGVFPAKITINEQATDLDVFAFKVSSKTHVGFDPSTGVHQGGFWAGKNLLGAYEWGDADSSDLADGWTVNGGWSATSFSGGEQRLVLNQASTGWFLKYVVFPFPNEVVTFSFSADYFNEGGGGSYENRIVLQSIRSTGGSQVFSNPIIPSFTGTISTSITTGSDSHILSCRLEVEETATGGDDAEYGISDPMIALGTSTTYTKL
jgi:hypothetical protein